jgi:predicted metal-binding protein
MRPDFKESFNLNCAGSEFNIELFIKFLPLEDAVLLRELSHDSCKKGCPNYGKNYSCPPHSLKMEKYVGKNEGLAVAMFCVSPAVRANQESTEVLDEIEANAYPVIDQFMRSLEKSSRSKYIASRNCRFCSPCRKVLGEKCMSPEKVRLCTSSLGLDCEELCRNFFGRSIVWQKKGEPFSGYVSYICALPVINARNKGPVLRETKNAIKVFGKKSKA